MNYDYLSGDGSDGHPASYVGMALQYRDYLLNNGYLHEMDASNKDSIPLD